MCGQPYWYEVSKNQLDSIASYYSLQDPLRDINQKLLCCHKSGKGTSLSRLDSGLARVITPGALKRITVSNDWPDNPSTPAGGDEPSHTIPLPDGNWELCSPEAAAP